MAFKKLKNLLHQRSDERPAIREALVLQKLNNIWLKEGILLFPKNVQKHLKKHAKVTKFRKNITTFSTNDVHSASVISLEGEKLKKIFLRNLPEINIEKIMVKQAEHTN